jgi:hypothetical protein
MIADGVTLFRADWDRLLSPLSSRLMLISNFWFTSTTHQYSVGWWTVRC